MKKYISVLIFAFFAVSTLSAQVRFGAKAGLNLANITESDAGDFDTKMLPTFHVGPIVEFGITESVFVQSGLLLSGRGYKYESDFLGTKTDISSNPLYLQIPAMVMYKGGMFYAGVGPYLAFGIAGKNKIGDSSESINFGSDDSDELKQTDFGANLEAGVDLNPIRVGLGYSLGLTNVIPNPVGDASIKHNAIMVSLSYLF